MIHKLVLLLPRVPIMLLFLAVLVISSLRTHHLQKSNLRILRDLVGFLLDPSLKRDTIKSRKTQIIQTPHLHKDDLGLGLLYDP